MEVSSWANQAFFHFLRTSSIGHLEIDEIVRKLDISFHPIVSNIIFPRKTLQICWGIHLFGQNLNTYIEPSFR